MLNKQIFFTDVHKAELLENEVGKVRENEVLTRMEYTVVSGGTERACLMGMKNTSQNFPMSLGYCGVGYVEEVGSKVNKVSVGDRVLVYHGCVIQSIIFVLKAIRIESPANAPQIYNELCDDKDFPIGTVFDWRNI